VTSEVHYEALDGAHGGETILTNFHLKVPRGGSNSISEMGRGGLSGTIRDPKGSRPFLQILSTEWRGVRLCWALSKSQGPDGR